MAILASNTGGKDFEPLSAGGHTAVCDMMVDLGMQQSPNSKYGPKHTVYIRFQIPEERIQYEKDGQEYDLPAVTGVHMTLSLSDKSHLKPFLESWRGKAFTSEEVREFDVSTVAGAPAYLNIIHEPGNKNGKAVVYANIASIMPIPRGMEKPTIEGELIIYDDEHEYNYDKLPKWLQDKIDNQIDEDTTTGAVSERSRPQPAAFDDDLDSDVPF